MSAASPRLCIYGAGLIGCYLGGRLHGHIHTQLIGRPDTLAALARRGLTVSGPQGERQIPVEALRLASRPEAVAGADLVLVTVKSAATEQVGAELAPWLAPGALVVSLQNGLNNTGRLRARLPAQRVLAGMLPFNVVNPRAGLYHQASGGELMVERDNALRPWLARFAAAGLPLHQRSDMPAVQRTKLLLNLNNVLNALSDLPLREQLGQRDWRRCLALTQAEALAVFDAAALPLARLTPLPSHLLPAVLRLPDSWFRRLAAPLLAIDPLARSSTWEDLRRGRPTEASQLQGEIVAQAARLGRRAPVNQRLLELIEEAADHPRRWQGKDLLTELRAAVLA